MAEKKAHPASDKKKEKARKDGQVLKSQILSQGAGLVFVVFSIYNFCSFFYTKIQEVFALCWIHSIDNFNVCIDAGANFAFFTISSILFSLVVITILSDFLQVGLKLEWSIIKFKTKNFNLAKGLLSLTKKIKDVLAIIVKVIIFCVITILVLYIYRENILNLFTSSRFNFLNVVSLLFFNIFSLLTLTIILVGVTDYFFKYRKYHADLSMSEQEVRDEYKELEGDPHLKAQRQALHEELMYKDIVKRVKECKVILVDRN